MKLIPPRSSLVLWRKFFCASSSSPLAVAARSIRTGTGSPQAQDESFKNPGPGSPAPELIYDGPLTSQMRRVKLFSLTTSVMGLALQPQIVTKAMEGETSMAATVAALGIVSVFTYVTPLMIHVLAKRYVTQVTFDPVADSYTATTYSFFLQKREHTFRIEDVTVPELPGMFTTLLVKSPGGKNVPLFMSDTAFLELKHYGRMMGYDKPIDFHMMTATTTTPKTTASRPKSGQSDDDDGHGAKTKIAK